MAKYLAKRIYGGHLDYNEVIAKYPQLKDAIDAELRKLGYQWE